MRRATILLGAIGIFICTGCASIVSKSRYPITINSNPSGATVTVKNKTGMEIHRATTPATLSLPASVGFFQPASYSFQFEKEGYNASSASISASIDPWYIGNLFFGGLIGLLIVDPATGAMWKLDDAVYTSLSENRSIPSSINSKTPLRPPKPETDDILSKRQDIISKLKELKDLKDSGILTEEEYETLRKALIEKL